ncbi:MAG: efflux RND transporter periplasmic adaptor subunit [Methylobacter sp.]
MGHDPGLSQFAHDSSESQAAEGVLDNRLWKHLGLAQNLTEYASAWLALFCVQLKGVKRALLVRRRQTDGVFETVAAWPVQEQASTAFADIMTLALQQQKGTMTALDDVPATGQLAYHAAYPLSAHDDGELLVAVHYVCPPDADLRRFMRTLQWAVPGLEVFLLRQGRGQPKKTVSSQGDKVILSIVSGVIAEPHFQSACYLLVHALAEAFDCLRVAIGFAGKSGQVEVIALSDAPQFDDKAGLVKQLAQVMDEAFVLPPETAAEPLLPCHERLGREHQSIVLSLALPIQGRRAGVLLLERAQTQKIEPEALSTLERLAALVAPLLDEKRQLGRSWRESAWAAIGECYARLLGTGDVAYKIRWALCLTALLFVLFADGEFRVTAEARLEGAVQQAIIAPVDGYIETAWVRAGDSVKSGERLFKMDDRKLILERDKWRSQYEQYLRQSRDALAQHERSKVRVLNAQLAQANAQIALLDAQIERATSLAPFDAVVVSGDLSQSLKAPVMRGDILFQLAPLDDYRLVLEVDERDIAEVSVGQAGVLLLASGADEALALTVEKLTPVADSRDGKNFFRVEARMASAPAFLRPGMKGIAKISVDERRYWRIWTRNLVNYLRLWLWRWI